MGNTHKRIVHTIIACMNSPDGLSRVFEGFLETSLNFSSNLIDQSLGWGNVDQDALIIAPQNLFHCIERDECLASAGRRNDEEASFCIKFVEHSSLPAIWLEGNAWIWSLRRVLISRDPIKIVHEKRGI